MYIIGLNFSHDYSACLLKDSDIRAALGLERLVRVRRGLVPQRQLSFAMQELVRYCLRVEDIGIDQVDFFIACSSETRSVQDERDLIPSAFFLPPQKVLTLPHPSHHLAHASASFYTSGFTEAAALVVDGYGSIIGDTREAESGFMFSHGREPEIVFRDLKPGAGVPGQLRDGRLVMGERLHGIGEVYRIVSMVLGFRQSGTYYDDAGKTMGLAPYGSVLSKQPVLIRPTDNGLDFSNVMPFLASYNLVSVEPSGTFLNVRPSGTPLSQFHCDLAAQVQWETEEACLHLARRMSHETKADCLVLGGGTFLNSVANGRILREAGFKDVFVFPAAADDGTAIGAAFYARMKAVGASVMTPRRCMTAALGCTYTPHRIEQAMSRYRLAGDRMECVEDAAHIAAEALASGKVIGWFQGGAEFGPRALGHRSILANPLVPGIKNFVNETVKFRESFRPFAPAVLEEDANRYFDLRGHDSPFMLLVCAVQAETQSLLKGVTHVDGTARVQTVSLASEPLFHALIKEFGRITGVPVVLNTSFNVRGMPIVETPEHALRCFLSTEMDMLIMDRYVVQAPDFASFVPVRHNLTVTTSGVWAGTDDGILRCSTSVTRRSAGSVTSGEVRLSAESLGMLEAIDGRQQVRYIAAGVGVPLRTAIRTILRLFRDGLVYWQHIGPDENEECSPRGVDVGPLPYAAV